MGLGYRRRAADNQGRPDSRPSPAAPDNLINQRVVVGLLTRRGHEVIVANNGLEALDALETRSVCCL